MTLPHVDSNYLVDFLAGLLNTPSPTGLTETAIEYVEKALAAFPEVTLERTRKGALLATLAGQNNDAPRALTAHVDTLGAMVKEVKSNGRLMITQLGGYPWNFIEGEGCTVFSSDGKKIRGSILVTKASAHVYGRLASETKRDEESLEVRLDERTTSKEETQKLGIMVGDFIAFDPRVELNNGFVRSRHLDDKACVANIVSAIKSLHDAGVKPLQKTYILISNYEEVGHGASAGLPLDAVELLAVDMAAVGNGQTSDEYHTTICVKDSGGPYHHGLSQRLRRLGDQEGIDYRVDIYPYYGSDGEALWRAGGNLAVALIGPGVDASHNYERTHTDALVATTQWVLAYLIN
ncbi:MAG: M42 family metallopeptidase [Anaerolineaceae bacterium]|nr:M42 family metallopeptidase [Anaerolineaceae bacterium]NTV35973.1 M42 family metallopeptidase [Anaerolineaceae bacterium]